VRDTGKSQNGYFEAYYPFKHSTQTATFKATIRTAL